MTRWSTPLQHCKPSPTFLSVLARSLLAGEPTAAALAERVNQTLGKEWRWVQPLVRRYAERFATRRRPRRAEVIGFLRTDEGLQRAFSKHGDELKIRDWLASRQEMLPVSVASQWTVPAIISEGDLAEWFGLKVNDLDWLADLKRLCARNKEQKLQHYHYRVLLKNTGSIRLIEVPKPRLKAIQRKILAEILERIPPHPAAHGFMKGRSIKTFAAPHAGQRVVLRMDLREFFPSIQGSRVQALFRTVGYPERVADLLGGLCTNAVPRDTWKRAAGSANPIALHELRQAYAWPHLPQGAPTSPALANLCAYRVDCRLSGLAHSADAVYTRYADDLAFSGDQSFEKKVKRFAALAAAILLEEGFEVYHRKTRIMHQGVRQYLAGVVANEHVNVVRKDFDRLKAILTNCVHHGPTSQNREQHPAFRQHLAGRIAFVEMINPPKGTRLRKIFERIEWARDENGLR